MPGFGLGPPLSALAPLRITLGADNVTTYIADGLTFSNVDPGGFEMCSLEIPKDLPQVLRGTPIRIDSGLSVAWEGRVAQIQRSLGNQTKITGEGYGALLKDNALAQIFVDQDFTQWQGPSVQRQINLVGAGFGPGGPQITSDISTGNPAIALQFTGSWAAGGRPVIEALYDSQGVPIASVYYSAVFGANAAGGVFTADVLLGTTDTMTTIDQTGNFSTNGSGTLAASAGNRVFVDLLAEGATATGGADGNVYAVYFDAIAVYGNHGLTGRGPAPVGFYSSDIAAYVADLVPGLQLGTVQTADQFILPQSSYPTPVGMDQIINDMAVAAGWHWGVWESPAPLTGNPTPRFDFRARPNLGEFTAFCLRRDCDTVDIQEDLSNQYDTAEITYTDVVGRSRAVSVTLDNPILDAANVHRTVTLNGGTMTGATAAAFGTEALALLAAQARVAGTVTISGPIDGPAGQMPAWMLRAGIDQLRIGDLPSTDAYGTYSTLPISRVETSASAQGFTTTVELGSGGSLVETLQARLSSVTTLAGQGGG